MLELLNHYSITDVIVFLVLFALALKGCINFWDWSVDRLRKVFKKESKQEQSKKALDEKLNQYDAKMNSILTHQEEMNKNISIINEKLHLLMDSDRDDIKAFITSCHHHYVYDKEWIDDYMLDSIEKRYSHYVEEGGNSYITNLMKELRALPKHPPKGN